MKPYTNYFDISFNLYNESFPYSKLDLNFSEISQIDQLPHGLLWTQPKLTVDGEYFGTLAIDKEINIVYIFKKDNNLKKYIPKYIYKSNKIYTFDFAINCLSFLIIYKDKPIVHYNIKSGKPIIFLHNDPVLIEDIFSSCFSPQCRYYGIATFSRVFFFDILNGKTMFCIEEKAEKKFISSEILISLFSNATFKMNSITRKDAIKEITFKIDNINNCNDILDCKIKSSLEYIFYITVSGIFKVSLLPLYNSDNDQNFDNNDNVKKSKKLDILKNIKLFDLRKIFFNDIKKGTISNDCNKFMTTDMEIVVIWDNTKGITNVLYFSKMSYLNIFFESEMIAYINEQKISIYNYSKNLDLVNEKKSMDIYIDKPISQILSYEFSDNDQFLLAVLDENNFAVWNFKTGELISKYFGSFPNWYKSISISPIKNSKTILALKSSSSLITLYDYSTGNDILFLPNFDCFSTCFSSNLKYLLVGTVKGNVIYKKYLLTKPLKEFIVETKNRQNLNTLVKFSKNDEYILCLSENENLILFDNNSNQFINEYIIQTKFSSILNYGFSFDSSFIYMQAFNQGNPYAYIFNINQSKVIKIFHGCKFIKFQNDSNSFLFANTSIDKPGKGEDEKYISYNIIKNSEFDLESYNISIYQSNVILDFIGENFLYTEIPFSDEGINSSKLILFKNLEENKVNASIIYKEIDKSKNKKFLFKLYINNNRIIINIFSVK